ncbi:MAG: hypothetical protein JNK82_17010, partial [Myxococcaceae bacterium]|nr:hypothetical protein [Myxococcaceae bacterium]
KAAYEHDFTLAEGRGPIFRAAACVTCHGHPVTGGSDNGTSNNVPHFMINNDGNYYLAFELGGPVVQHLSIAGEPGAEGCSMAGETLPTVPKISTSDRHSPPVFGFGALDAVADEDIFAFAGRKPYKHPSVIGAVNWSNELQGLVRLWAFTFDANRRAPSGPVRAGRFGWKSQTGTLFQFTTEPFNIELGVSTPFFPREFSPDGSPLPLGHPCQKAAATPNDVGSKGSIELFHFQALLAPPPPLLPMTLKAHIGKAVFAAVGCADCHRPALKTVEDYYLPLADGTAHRVDALSDKIIFPYSDLLIHDMGPGLEDGRVMGRASGRFWRTTPLWGLRFKTRYMHDGRTDSEEQSILLHGGEGQYSTDRFIALPRWQKDALLEFLEHL